MEKRRNHMTSPRLNVPHKLTAHNLTVKRSVRPRFTENTPQTGPKTFHSNKNVSTLTLPCKMQDVRAVFGLSAVLPSLPPPLTC